jgi:uncharacterized protein (UPF0332 family)
MGYADDLLRLARQIAELYPNEVHQGSLRRALSTAYYALFHLLIADAVSECESPSFRAAIARLFDHGAMRQACDKKTSELNKFFKAREPVGPETRVKDELRNVAETFSAAQYNRHEADYNLTREWQPIEVELLIGDVEDAFRSWNSIRTDAEARDFLVSMLSARDRKRPEKQSLVTDAP